MNNNHLRDKIDTELQGIKPEDDSLSKIKKIAAGFKIVQMKMKNAATGKVLWECNDWDVREGVVKDVHFPREMLECE